MTFSQRDHPDIDDEDRARAANTILRRDWMWVEHLRASGVVRGGYERTFLGLDPDGYDDTDRLLLRRLVWHYRRAFPASMRLKINPADPIVRECIRRPETV